MEEKGKFYGGRALLPVVVFLGLYLGCGIAFTIQGADSAFGYMPRYVAVLIAILAGLLGFEPHRKLSEKLDIYLKGAGSSGVHLLGIIVLLAGGFAQATAAIGGQDSMVNLGITLIPTQFLVPGIFIICCLISTCTGTSMGTQVTMIPIAIAMAEGAGVSSGMAGAAAIAGAYFGDNLSMISDTTIISVKGVDGDMREKFLLNCKIAIPAAIVSIILYVIMGSQTAAGVAQEAGSYNILTILPYFAVLGLSVAGMDVVLVLASGSVLSLIIGLATGTIGFFDWSMAMGEGMEDMFWLAVFASLVSGMMSLVRYYGGIQWMVDKSQKFIKSSKSCQYVIGLLVMAISGTTLNNAVASLISAPVAKDLGAQYNVSKNKLATLLSIFSCAILMVVPHDSGCLLVQQYGGCSYLDILQYAYYPVLLVLFTCITIQFDLFSQKRKDKKAAAKE
ncbi:MAG: Na+/H+ antiporter NhaC family protein [Clostridiales bacterium]|nr:Na+/H+ antiporter NhaC family protein [Clostridiales bacterium]